MRARVTPRTIRYYVEQGVLPPPGRGRPAEYTSDHLRRLALIRRLKEQYLPLEEIRDTMQRLTLDEVEELLAHSSAQVKKESAPASSASEYIAGVLDQTAVREQMKRESVHLPPPPMASPPASLPQPIPAQAPSALSTQPERSDAALSTENARTLDEVEELLAHSSAQVKKESAPASSASEYIAGVLDQTAVREQMKRESVHLPPPPMASPPASLPQPIPAQAPSALSTQPERSDAALSTENARTRKAAWSEPPQAQMEQTAAWQRITLATGIELHYALTEDARTNRIAAQIIEAAQSILDNDPGANMEEPK